MCDKITLNRQESQQRSLLLGVSSKPGSEYFEMSVVQAQEGLNVTRLLLAFPEPGAQTSRTATLR
jgi:hypothetical protein